MKLEVIYLDMDGVVVDLARSMLRVFGQEHLLDENPGPLNEHMAKALGIDDSTFWRVIGAAGLRVWIDAPRYEWSVSLYERMKELAREVIFLSSPSWDPVSLAGKLMWLQYLTGEQGFRDYVFTSKKYLLAYPGAVLVDDRKSNIQEFEEAGGHVVLFPQPWNSATLPDGVTRVDYVAGKIEDIAINE
jgi:hypothetical protein